MRVRVVGPNLPIEAKATFHVHAAECSDLRKGWIRHCPDGWFQSIESRIEVEAFAYDFAPDEDDSYTLGDYLSEFHFAPCVTVPTFPTETVIAVQRHINLQEDK